MLLFPLVTHCLTVVADWDWIFMCMEKRGRNGCARNFREFLNGNPICLQEKLWRVCTKNLENSLGGTFAGM